MPITQQSGVTPWTRENIDIAPQVAGLYVLRNFPGLNGIIYIGKSGNIRDRLLEHYNNSDIPQVSYFDWYRTDTIAEMDRLERVWIVQYNPKYNQRIG